MTSPTEQTPYLWIDAPMGAAGDMLLAACLDAGASETALRAGLARLGIDAEFDLRIERVVRQGIAATAVTVEEPLASPAAASAIAKASAAGHDAQHTHAHAHLHPHAPPSAPLVAHEQGRADGAVAHAPHGQAHRHGHDHGPAHAHAPGSTGHAHGHAHGPHRHLQDMLALLERADYPAPVADGAAAVFRCIAEAEATVHGTTPEKVHFHEVSGIDTLIDVVGVCLALEDLGVARVGVGPVAVGGGTIRCAHGLLPVPAPAVAGILARYGLPQRGGPVERELLTPTGAALLAVLTEAVDPAQDSVLGTAPELASDHGSIRARGSMPAMTIDAIGYGAGQADPEGHPNVVRVQRGHLLAPAPPAAPAAPSRSATLSASALPARQGEEVPPPPGVESDTVLELRTVSDDLAPEGVAHWLDACLAAGALDGWITPVVMKKGRPGHAVTVLCGDAALAAVEAALFRTGRTLGARVERATRHILARALETVTVDDQSIRVKVGRLGGEPVSVKAEWADCLAASRERTAPPQAFASRAEALVWERLQAC